MFFNGSDTLFGTVSILHVSNTKIVTNILYTIKRQNPIACLNILPKVGNVCHNGLMKKPSILL